MANIIYNRLTNAVTTAVLLTAVGISFAYQVGTATAAPPVSETQAKSLFEQRCSACHDLPDPVAHGYTKLEWRATVNRMLNQHDARTSISDDEATEIVDYLGQFAPRLGAPIGTYGIGVWQTDPLISVSYPFTFGPNLSSFDIHNGSWKIVPSADANGGFLKAVSANGIPATLLENKNNLVGGLDLQVKFQSGKPSEGAAIGLMFGANNDRDYYAAEFSPASSTVTLLRVNGGQTTVLQQSPIVLSLNSSESPWHSLRVKITEKGTAIEVSMDYQKVISSSIPDWTGGRFGLKLDGPAVVSYRNLTADSYQGAEQSPAGDVMLH